MRDFITYDMGGTSTDVCLVRDLAPLTTSDGMLGAFPVKVPRSDMHRCRRRRRFDRVAGPGRQPSGRAAQRQGYAGPGRLRPRRHRADGDRRQRGARPNRNHPAPRGSIAIDAIARIGRSATSTQLGRSMTLEALAEGVVRIAVARMNSAIREISIQRGHDPRDFTLIAFGGA